MSTYISSTQRTGAARAVLAFAGLLSAATPGLAQSTTPTYTASWTDCRTADNRFKGTDGAWYWDVDAGCDIYQIDTYERPMTQAFQLMKNRFAAKEYFEYLDIVGAKAGFDSTFLYVAIDLQGRAHRTSGGSIIPVGMAERYGFKLSLDPDGRHGILVVADQPEFKNAPKTKWGRLGTFAYADVNGDVGGAADSGPTGLGVTNSDNPDEEDGMNGYEQNIIADGRLSGGQTVLWVRVNSVDRSMVEFALNYAAVGLTQDDLRNLGNLEFEAVKGGPKDPQNYRWNDLYSAIEAGSPNKGLHGLSEFGTSGCEGIYELDTLRGGDIEAAGPGDLDGDGSVTLIDAAEFHNAFAAGRPTADMNADGTITYEDAIEFFAIYNAR